jgi:hypothetical protein
MSLTQRLLWMLIVTAIGRGSMELFINLGLPNPVAVAVGFLLAIAFAIGARRLIQKKNRGNEIL